MTVNCPQCGIALYVPDEGKFTRRCPCCGSLLKFTMGQLEQPDVDLEDEEGEDDE